MTKNFIFEFKEGCQVILDEINRVQEEVGLLPPGIHPTDPRLSKIAGSLQLRVGDLLQFQADTTPFRVSQRFWRVNAEDTYELVISLTPP
jgi:hypothetical protein